MNLKTTLAAASALAMACAAPAAHALSTSSTGSASFGSLAATDTTNNSTAVTTAATPATVSLSKFDSSLGVLTGATLSASFATNPTFTVLKGTGSGNPTGDGSFSEGVNLSGFSTLTNSTGNVAFNGTAAFTGFGSSSASNLDALVGTGSLSATLNAATSANKTNSSGASLVATAGSHTTNLNLSYSYLSHANASFSSGGDSNSLALSAGSSFNVFALGTAGSTTLLDGLSITCTSGDCGAFDLSLASFADIAAGSSVSGLSSLLATAAGNYFATFELKFSDDTAVGAASSRQQNSLFVELSGSVSPVPENESYAMFLAGIAALGVVSRRRRAAR